MGYMIVWWYLHYMYTIANRQPKKVHKKGGQILDESMSAVVCHEPYGDFCENTIMIPTEIPGTYFMCCKKKMCRDFILEKGQTKNE